ncbi:MAG: UDP-N-acetylmuramoyl-tripeptide--D-alanyl-D-alanine ligase [Chloroflexota bacterium]|nr:MAG: UDP-N-acetylmuramoyl-tripeptide--D-alanyl-D-alanine ligase [Chloroflexota bacterium]
MLDLGFILTTLTDYRPTGQEPLVSSVVIDSRKAKAGSLFICFVGENADGHDFVLDAFERGAVAALVERPTAAIAVNVDAARPWLDQVPEDETLPLPICVQVRSTLQSIQTLGRQWRARFPGLRTVGITGSVGKTTTKELTHAVLSRRFNTLKSEGNYNNEIGLPLTLLRIRPWHQRAVLEMGMYTSGEISLLCDLARPDVGVVTIIGTVHMEWLGSIEAIAAAKQELVEALPAAPNGTAILNKDDDRVMQMADHTQARVFTYGLDSQADVWADNILSMGLDGIYFSMHHGLENLNVQVPLLGRHSVHTALRASAVGLVEGLTWDEIVHGLQGLTSQLRLVAVPGPRNSIVLDDTYNSSPESAVAALNLLADLDGRRVAVMGDMLELGPAEEHSHRLVGRRAKDVADILLTVGELGRLIGEEALVAGMRQERVFMVSDADEAGSLLEEIIRTGDVVLVKGSRGIRLDKVVTALGRD